MILDGIRINTMRPCGSSFIYIELLYEEIVDLAAHWSENTLLGEGFIKNLLDSNRSWNANRVPLNNVQLFIQVRILTKLSHC